MQADDARACAPAVTMAAWTAAGFYPWFSGVLQRTV
jgi:hypothetical protein